jgi:uncharacterized protein YqgV (UPF0045/DUF77 family)
MGVVTVQVSLYPLQQASIGPTIRKAVRALRGRGLNTRVGATGTLVWGDDESQEREP